MKIIFSLFTVCLCLTCIVTSNAQKNKKEKEEPPISVWDIDTLKNPIPMNRAMFTDKISAQSHHRNRRYNCQ
jgi:hypothetical protein